MADFVEYFNSLWRYAGNLYKNRQLQPALEAYNSLLDIAIKIKDEDLIALFTLDIGNCLMQLGKLKEALAKLAPLLERGKISSNNRVTFSALVRYIEIAQKIPVSLDKIEAVYKKTDFFLKDTNNLDWKHELLVFKSRLHFFKGEFQESLDLGKNALALKKIAKNPLGQVFDFHYDGIIMNCIKLKSLEDASYYLAEWNNSDDVMPMNRKVRLTKCKAAILLESGDYSLAVDYALEAFYYASQTDYEETLFSSLIVLIESLIQLKFFNDAKDKLLYLFRLRHTERIIYKYDIFKCFGHFHSAHFKLNGLQKNNKYRASQAYDNALSIGNELDERFNTSFYHRQLLKKYN